MGRLQIVLSDEVEKRLRDTIYRVRGSWKKGYISEAVEEAIDDWVSRHSKTSNRPKPQKKE